MFKTTTRALLLSAASIAVLACTPATSDSIAEQNTQVIEAIKADLPAGVTFVERYTGEGDDIAIPYEKYELDNGLTVVLHEDRSDPLVHVDVTYHVGSGREEVGRSGFAHFFEHMMFQGSENVADEQHFALITESGGTLNGTTNSDRTNYFETVPNNQLERMLWLEADRMGFFLDAVTQEKFEVQRETVKNERGQRVDNQPYGRLGERVNAALYPEGHPYSWSTIGYMEDLDRADLDDLKRFFLRWYGPNNAVLTIGGDLDRTQTLEWIVKYFGNIPRGPEVEKPTVEPFTLDADRYISMEDNVQLPLIYMAWPTVTRNHPDEAPLDVLMTIIGVGKTSLLYKNLEKEGLALQASAGHGCAELGCRFTMLALANPSTVSSLSELEPVMRASLEEFEASEIDLDAIERTKADIVSGLIYGLESVSGKVSQLASYETFGDSPNGIGYEVSRYENVTVADVRRVYEEYIKGKPAVIMSVVPNGATDAIARPDTFTQQPRTIPPKGEVDDVAWSAPEDSFDRSVIPSPGPAPAISAPDVYRAEVGGIPVLGAVNGEVPTTTVTLRVQSGQMDEPLDKLGLANLTARMLNEASTTRTVEERSNALGKLGSSVNVSAGDRYTSVNIRTLTRNLDETIAIAMDALQNPKFDQADFARLQDNTLQGIEADKKDAGSVASNLFNRLTYGSENSYANPNSGTAETVANLTLDDVKQFYSERMSPSISSVIVVSDLGEAEVVDALAPLADWTGPEVSITTPAVTPEGKPGLIYFVDKPDAAQSEIRIGKPSLPYDATGEFYRAQLMNFPLGGAFNSRINLNLREDKGYTYGARSGFSGQQGRGAFIASSAVRSDATKESLAEFVKEISAFHADGPTEEEVTFTRQARAQSEARQYETPGQKSRILFAMDTYGLDADYLDERKDILAAFTQDEAQALAAEHLDMSEMYVVVVGDKATQMDRLKDMGMEIVEVDADGVPVK